MNDTEPSPNFFQGSMTLPITGSGSSGILVLYKGASKADLAKQLPLQGGEGYRFDKLAQGVGLGRDHFWLACLDGLPLEQTIADLKPKVILSFGEDALKQLIPGGELVIRQAYINEDSYLGVPVVPTYGLRDLIQGQAKLTSCVKFAFCRAVETAKQGVKRAAVKYLLDPLLPELEAYCTDWSPEQPLAFDIETPESGKLDTEEEEEEDPSYQVLRVSASWKETEAISTPWCEPYISFWKDILLRAKEVVFWNHSFDVPRLRAAGVEFGGTIVDAQWSWHFLQSDLKKKLGFVAPFFCLHASTRVQLWNSKKTVKISDLVTTKQKVTLKGCNHLGQPIPVEIKAWHRNEVKNQKWLAVKVENTNQPIYCTPDHGIWTKRGLVKAEWLNVNDWVRIPKVGENSLIHGTLLGDGCVGEGGHLNVTHCMADGGWTDAKAAGFGLKGKRRKTSKNSHTGGKDQWGFSVPVGRDWRRNFYPNGKKIFIPPPDDAALAVWYGDDGTFTRLTTIGARIFIAGFQNTDAVYEWAKKEFGAQNISHYGKGNNTECIAFKKKGAELFFERIAQWLHPSMSRKLPQAYHCRYNGWMDYPKHQWGKVKSISPYQPPKWSRRRNVRYCVTVSHPTHRFFTNGGLVSNCDLAPWKHLAGSEPALYSAIDADATIRCHLGIRAALEKEGRWKIFDRHCTHIMPLLSEMGGKGLLVDRERQVAFKRLLEADLLTEDAKLQQLVPKPLYPRKPYKRLPKDTAPELIEEVKCQHCPVPPLPDCILCKGTGIEGYSKILPFNFNSPPQVKRLIQHFGLTVPKNRKTQKDTTGAKYIKRFGKKHEVFAVLNKCSEIDTMLTTFIWPIRSDGRVGTNYGWNPSTWRKSSKNVNLQNIPKRSSLAKEFRKMLVASPGCLLLEADSSAIEAVLVGYHAGDEGYIRAAKAGIHSFITSNWIKEPVSLALPDAELRIALKEVKKAHPDRYESAKRGGHATNYLLTAYGLYDEYPEYFKSQKEAEGFQEFYFDLFPKIRQWHQHTLERVHHDGYLDNHFGYRHRFFDVYRYDGSYGKWKLGNDAKRVIAFSPQSDGSAIQSEYLTWVAEDEEIRSYLRLLIHDSFIFEFPEKRLDTVAQWVHSCMSRPIIELGGLTVGAEVSFGRNLGEMQVMEF